jgi:hypothetical protein
MFLLTIKTTLGKQLCATVTLASLAHYPRVTTSGKEASRACAFQAYTAGRSVVPRRLAEAPQRALLGAELFAQPGHTAGGYCAHGGACQRTGPWPPGQPSAGSSGLSGPAARAEGTLKVGSRRRRSGSSCILCRMQELQEQELQEAARSRRGKCGGGEDHSGGCKCAAGGSSDRARSGPTCELRHPAPIAECGAARGGPIARGHEEAKPRNEVKNNFLFVCCTK